MILTAKELKAKYRWVPSKDITDATYWTPTFSFICEVSDTFWEIVQQYDLDEWEKFWDCDNFAMLYHTVAHAVYAKKYAKKYDAQAPALGQISYRVWNSKHESPGNGHRIITYVDGRGKKKYLEPQAIRAMATGKEVVSLDKREIRTIWKVYM